MTVREYIVIDPKLPQGVREATPEDISRGVKGLVPAKQYQRLVNTEDVIPGCIAEFQRDFAFWTVPGFLGRIMKLFNRKWDGYGWHVGVVTQVERGSKAIKVLEAQPLGAREVRIENFYDKKARNYRFWDLLGRELEKNEVRAIIAKYEGASYDFQAYFWTALAMIFGLSRKDNGKYMCWELVYHIYRDLDAPIAGGDKDRPILTELNMACRGLLQLSDKEHARHNHWYKTRIKEVAISP
ncbi:MAG: hypothetical protein FWF37_01615 [Chloroflexi bacterium]|nr:hypothetical protein [Chloroflexota bacterium]